MPWRTLFSDWVHLVVQSWWWSCYPPWTGPVGNKVVCWYVRGYTTSRIPGHWSGQNFQSSTLKIRYYSFSKHCIHISIVFNAAITDRCILPYASQPMGNQHVKAQEKNQHSCTIFQVSIQLSNHSSQPQEPDNLQGAEKAPNALKKKND